MSPQELDCVRYRLARAREALDEGELLLRSGHLHTAVNRIYYACLYAVSALLCSAGKSSSKHSGVIALFDRHWIKDGRLPVEMARFYRRMFDERQRGDYGDVAAFGRGDIGEWLQEAHTFV